MKRIYIIATLMMGMTMAFMSASCSKDSDKFGNDAIEETEKEIEKVVDKICLDWNASPSKVESKMKGFNKVVDDGDFAAYKAKKADYQISYDFANGMLRSSVAVMPMSAQIDKSAVFSLDGYKYEGEIDGASVYTDVRAGNMAMMMTREIDNVEYLSVGFSPIESELFERLDPINIDDVEAIDVTSNSMSITWSVSGDWKEDFEKAGVDYSMTPDMTDAMTRTTSSAGSGRFKINLTNLTVNSTYYYMAFIIVDGIRYESEVYSQALDPVKTYKIGDFYPDDSNPEGVVCSVSGNGEHGKIVSLDQGKMQWDVNSLFCTDYGCNSNSDGSKNNMGNTQPFAKWVRNHGADWYGPARYELRLSREEISAINSTLSSKGYPILRGFYWTSTEHSSNTAYVVTVCTDGYMGYSNQFDFYNSKNQNNSTIAFKKF